MLKVYQIYFKDEQLTDMDYTPYRNDDCTVFFENSVIRKLIEEKAHEDSDYFGVVSYQLKRKMGVTKTAWRGKAQIHNVSGVQFSTSDFQSKLMTALPDVMSFGRHMGHDPVTMADAFHPKFSMFFKEIMRRIGYSWEPVHINDIVYCNHFVAKSGIYEGYVKNMLSPAMDVMEQMPELYQNSFYPCSLPDNLKVKFGVDYYPYHTFLAERFFSFYMHIHKLNCLHY